MSRVMKILAIVVLLVTVAGAGAVLYGLNTLTPQVEQVTVTQTPASETRDAFDSIVTRLAEGTFAGTVFADTDGLSAEECTFVTYTVRLNNRGFFPAEWITLDISMAQASDGEHGDVLQIGDSGAYVLAAGSRGDISATLLTTLPDAQTPRSLLITCYVFGQKLIFEASAD